MFVFYDYVCEGMTIAIMKCRERSTNTAYELTFNVDGKVSKYYCEKVITVAESLSRRCGEEIKKIIIVADDIDYSTYKYTKAMDIDFQFADKYTLGLELFFYYNDEIQPVFVNFHGFAEHFIFEPDDLINDIDKIADLTSPGYYIDKKRIRDRSFVFYARDYVPIEPLPDHIQKALDDYVISKSLGEIKKNYVWHLYEGKNRKRIYEPY